MRQRWAAFLGSGQAPWKPTSEPPSQPNRRSNLTGVTQPMPGAEVAHAVSTSTPSDLGPIARGGFFAAARSRLNVLMDCWVHKPAPRLGLMTATVFLLAAVCGCQGPGGQTLTLVSWNVHHCEAGVDAVAAALQSVGPDVICLQETKSGRWTLDGVHQGERIAERLSMRQFSSDEELVEDHEEQASLLYHGELRDTELLKAGNGRAYGVTAVIDWEGMPIRVVCLHLTDNSLADPVWFFRTGWHRLREVADLARRLDRWKGEIIVAGDFNAIPGMPEHLIMASRLLWVPFIHPTHPTALPLLCLDHVYHARGLHVGSLEIRSSSASDHLMVIARVQVRAGGQETGYKPENGK